MKKIITLLAFFTLLKGYSQQTVDVNSGNTIWDVPAGSYIKDMYGDFDNLLVPGFG